MISVPSDFADGIVTLAGDAGRDWIAGLPTLVETLCRRWSLRVDGAPMHGALGLVVPVTRGGEELVLKVSWRDESTLHEIAALAAWNGHGAARLYQADPELGAMVLERLDRTRHLSALHVDEAFPIAGRLLRRLAIPAPPEIPRLSAVAEKLTATIPERWERLNRPIPRATLDASRDVAVRLGPLAGDRLVNYDLHDDNVLAGPRERWLAIDPKVVAGDLEYGVAQLLWTRLHDIRRHGGLDRHVARLVEAAELDPRLTRAWTLVRCVDYWLWALSVGLTEDPLRCAEICEWLVEG